MKKNTVTFLADPTQRLSHIRNTVERIKQEVEGDTEVPTDGLLLSWIRFYLRKQVVRVESDNTAQAKINDLDKFVRYFYKEFRHGLIKDWDQAVTQAFVDYLEKEQLFQLSTCHRIYATISNLATFIIMQEGIKPADNPCHIKLKPLEDLPEPRGIQAVDDKYNLLPYSGEQLYQYMLQAAQSRIGDDSPRAKPLRDVAILGVLYGTGLRVSEMCGLQFDRIEFGSRASSSAVFYPEEFSENMPARLLRERLLSTGVVPVCDPSLEDNAWLNHALESPELYRELLPNGTDLDATITAMIDSYEESESLDDLRVLNRLALEFALPERTPVGQSGLWFTNLRGKGGKPRRVYLPGHYARLLIPYMDSDERKSDKDHPFLFQSYRGKPLTRTTIFMLLRGFADQAAREHLPPGSTILVSPHSLRHEKGYRLHATGFGDSFIARGLGNSVKQASRYSRGSRIAEERKFEKA